MPLNSDYLEETPRPETVLRLTDPTDAGSSLNVIQGNGCLKGIHGEVVPVTLITLNMERLAGADFAYPRLSHMSLTLADLKRLVATLQHLVQEEESVEWVSIEETPLP